MHEIDWTGGMLTLSYFLGLVSKHDANDLAPAEEGAAGDCVEAVSP
jgi:hypothetical protein